MSNYVHSPCTYKNKRMFEKNQNLNLNESVNFQDAIRTLGNR